MLLQSFHFVASVVPKYLSYITRAHNTYISSHLLTSTRGLVSRRRVFESLEQIKKFHCGRYNKLYSNHANKNQSSRKGKSTVYYVVALGVLVGGLSYAAVPLYRLFCQVCLEQIILITCCSFIILLLFNLNNFLTSPLLISLLSFVPIFKQQKIIVIFKNSLTAMEDQWATMLTI